MKRSRLATGFLALLGLAILIKYNIKPTISAFTAKIGGISQLIACRIYFGDKNIITAIVAGIECPYGNGKVSR